MMKDKALVERGFKLILEGLGLQLDDPHVAETPKRAARAWYDELCIGLTGKEPKITTFPDDTATGLIICRNIPVKSMCSHHLLPFFGEAVVGYVPGRGEILGLSKLSRVVNFWARRPQVQERLTAQIADHIWELIGNPWPMGGQMQYFNPEPTSDMTGQWTPDPVPISTGGGVGVLIRARHLCMELRGVNHASEMVTSELRGCLMAEPEARAEFLELARQKEA